VGAEASQRRMTRCPRKCRLSARRNGIRVGVV
jgi:hypothetical protein